MVQLATRDVVVDVNEWTRHELSITYRVGTPDEAVIDEHFAGPVDSYHLRWMIDAVSAGVFVDVGANIGVTTLLALAMGAPCAYAIEPNRENFALLATNLAANDATAYVATWPGAVWSDDLMEVEPIGTSATAVVRRPEPDSGELVPAMSLPDVIAQAHRVAATMTGDDSIGVMKVDVEGAEYPWLLGQPGRNSRCMLDVPQLVMEWHATTHAQYGQLVAMLADTHAVQSFGRVNDGGHLYAHRY